MDKGIIIAYLALALVVGCFAAFVVYLDECVKSLYRERSKVNGDISEAEGRLATVRGLCEAAESDLGKATEEYGEVAASLSEATRDLENIGADLDSATEALLAARAELDRERREAMSYGVYSAVGCALLNGMDMAGSVFPIHEVPYLASGIDTLGLRHPAGYEMKRKGLLTVGDIVKADPDTLTSIMGVGPGTVDTIARKLEENSCCFGMEFVRINDRYFVKH